MFADTFLFAIYSPFISSITLTHNALANGATIAISGNPFPVYHLLIVLSLTSKIPASSSCVIFLLSLNFLLFFQLHKYSLKISSLKNYIIYVLKYNLRIVDKKIRGKNRFPLTLLFII